MLDGLPADVRRLLAKRIESLEQLEVLLVLRRDGVARTCVELAHMLGASEDATARALAALAAQGLVAVDGTRWSYAPATDALRDDVRALADYYVSRRLDVVNAVSGKALARIRAFADAFRLHRDDDGV